MKLNDLIQRFIDRKDEYIQKSLYNGGRIDIIFHLTINGIKYLVRTFGEDTFDGVYSMVEDVVGEPHTTTLSKYNKYKVEDYSVETICEKHYDGVIVYFYLEIEMIKPRKCPTLEEVIRRYDLDKKRAENEYEYALNLVVDHKRISYGLEPDILFKYRDYEVKRMYKSTAHLYTNGFRVGLRYILFLKK